MPEYPSLLCIVLLTFAPGTWLQTVSGNDGDVRMSEMMWIQHYNSRNGSNKPELKLDSAWLTVNSSLTFDLELYAQNDECWKCPLQWVATFRQRNVTTILVNTTHATSLMLKRRIPDNQYEDICPFHRYFVDEGDYWIFMNWTTYTNSICHVILANEPPSDLIPLFVTFGILIFLRLAWGVLKYLFRIGKLNKEGVQVSAYNVTGWGGMSGVFGMMPQWQQHFGGMEFANTVEPAWNSPFHKKTGHRNVQKMLCCFKSSEMTPPQPLETTSTFTLQPYDGSVKDHNSLENGSVDNGSVKENGISEKPVDPEKKPKQRLKSLDCFRGFSLAFMIFINYGGGGYWYFKHPAWHGITGADLVFPWFVFIMGTSMALSFRSMLKKQIPRYKLLIRVIRRSLIIFALGIMYNTSFYRIDLSMLRYPGVLQRLALTYLILGTVEVFCARGEDSHQERVWAPVRDLVLFWPEWLVNLSILGLYCGLTYGLPVPNCPTGYTGPGGISEGGKYYNCTGGAAAYIDYLLLGPKHIYPWADVKALYQTHFSFEPEGILGTLSSVFTCFLGLQAGRILMYPGHVSRIKRWTVWAVLTGALAALLTLCTQHEGWVPLNKNLWSVSFSLATSSLAFAFLTILYVFVDVLGWWDGTPFIYPGMNSIVIYMCHGLLGGCFPVTWKTEMVHWKLLVRDLWGPSLWMFVAYVLFKKKIFVAI